MNLVTAGFIFRDNPALGSFQLLYARSIIANISIAVWLRGDLKRVTYDEVVGQHNKELSFRSAQSAWANMIKTISQKYISLTLVSVIANLAPPLTVVMALLLLGEGLRMFEGVLMTLQLGCAMLVLFGAPGTDYGAPSSNVWMRNFMYMLCVFNAVTSAVGNIAMRQMKKFRGVVTAWYGGWAMMLFSFLAVSISGNYGVTAFYTFSAWSWFLLLINGVTATGEQVAQFKAYSLQNAAKLQLLNPTVTIFQFFSDMIIFKMKYTKA